MPKLATKANFYVIDKLERKIIARDAIRAGKEFTLFISNEDMDDLIKIVETPKKSGLLVDGVAKTVKHKIKKQGCEFLGARMAPMAVSLIAPMVSLLIQPVTFYW